MSGLGDTYWLGQTVHDIDPEPTGLLDSKGRPLYREPNRMGFDTTPVAPTTFNPAITGKRK